MLSVKIFGSGKINLVFIHGWGLNTTVFESISEKLANIFTISFIDLPGYGYNVEQLAQCSFEELLEQLNEVITPNSVLLGWSLGGLIAMKYSLKYPKKLRGLITVCSSPCFTQQEVNSKIEWEGMPKRTLKAFNRILKPTNKDQICDKFLAIQAIGSPSIRKDIRALKQVILKQPRPTYESLMFGLKLLEEVDLRDELNNLEIPSLHCFGNFDRLVPNSVTNYWKKIKNANVELFEKSAHNPFLSEQEEFIKKIKDFIIYKL